LVLIGAVVRESIVARRQVTACADCPEAFSFAVFGDYPYDSAQLARFPQVAKQINADKDVSLVAHLGDIKDDGDCSTSYYREIRADFDRFADPLVYTPGDNEWADCYRRENGAHDPLERLKMLRTIFFNHPGRTLGQDPAQVSSQAAAGFPENVRFTRAEVSFGTFHTTGPRNGLVVWTGKTAPTRAERTEVDQRTQAAVRNIEQVFATAKTEKDRSVVLFTQADMFSPERSTLDALPYRPIVQAIAAGAASFSGPVYLFNGDTHRYSTGQPLAAGEKWPKVYKVKPVDNLTRVTVDGDENANNYLKVTIRPYFSRVMSWQPIGFTN
jgi:hypothetical protein